MFCAQEADAVLFQRYASSDSLLPSAGPCSAQLPDSCLFLNSHTVPPMFIFQGRISNFAAWAPQPVLQSLTGIWHGRAATGQFTQFSLQGV